MKSKRAQAMTQGLKKRKWQLEASRHATLRNALGDGGHISNSKFEFKYSLYNLTIKTPCLPQSKSLLTAPTSPNAPLASLNPRNFPQKHSQSTALIPMTPKKTFKFNLRFHSSPKRIFCACSSKLTLDSDMDLTLC